MVTKKEIKTWFMGRGLSFGRFNVPGQRATRMPARPRPKAPEITQIQFNRPVPASGPSRQAVGIARQARSAVAQLELGADRAKLHIVQARVGTGVFEAMA